MMSGRQALAEWFERQKIQKQQFVANLRKRGARISKAQLSQFLSGYRRPKLETMIAIEEETGVPVKSWADKTRGRSDRGRKHSVKSTPVYKRETEVRVG